MKFFIPIFLFAAGFAVLPARAQSPAPPFPVALEKQLAARASNYTEVSLDKKMLGLATKFMNGDDAEAKHLVENLDGIYVREYDFDKPGQYTTEDLEHIRQQFDSPEWTPMVKERSKNGDNDTDVYMKMINGSVKGMFVLDAEPKELDFVFISGPILPEQLSDLGGNFGIPRPLRKRLNKETK